MLLALEKSPNIQESKHVDCADLRDLPHILRGAGCLRELMDMLLALKKSPNIEESNMWIVWICETVA